MKHTYLSAGAILLAVPTTVLSAQAGRIRTTLTPGGSPGPVAFGSAVAALGDINFDGVQDFAAGGPGGNPAPPGMVRAFDGASGAILWTRFGTGSDQFGSGLASIRDFSGDGKRDLIVAAPGATSILKALDGLSGAVLTTQDLTGLTAFDSMAIFPGDVDPLVPDGEPDLVVLGGGSVHFVSSGLSSAVGGFISLTPTQPARPQETVVSAAMNYFGTGPCVALGAPSLNEVRLLDLVTGEDKIFTGSDFGPSISGLGTSLCFDPENQLVLCGAPNSFGGNGAVATIDTTGDLNVASNLAQQLGRSLAVGDLDGNGHLDFVAGARDSAHVFLGDGSVQTAFVPGLIFNNLGDAIAVVGDANGDGAEEFVVGFPTTLGGGAVHNFFGGPISRAFQNFRPGCTAGGFQPTLRITSVPAISPGTSVTIDLNTGGLNGISVCVLLVGTPDPIGTPVAGSAPSCTLWLGAPTVLTTLQTDSSGFATFTSAPVSSALLGLAFAFQAITSDSSGSFSLTNAASAAVGW